MCNLLEMKNITKIFPGGVVANDHIDLTVKKGEIHALLGENGAGKSTLMSILSGLYRPTFGQISINNKTIKIKSPLDSIHAGIGMVYQEFMLIPQLSVAENIILGSETQKHTMYLDIKNISEKLIEFSNNYKMRIDPYAKVWQLSVGQQQRVEIIKVLFKGANLLILDEPTSVLTPQETDELFCILRELVKKKEYSIIFISHKLDEVKTISDRVTVLRGGKKIKTLPTNCISKKELAKMMIGREVGFEVNKTLKKHKKVVLKLEDIEALSDKRLKILKGISMEIHEGEILGIAGIDGNGQLELAEVITGLRKVIKGKISLFDINITNNCPRTIIERDVGYIPADRHLYGLVLTMDINHNIILKDYYMEPHSKHKFLNWDFIKDHTRKLINKYDIKASSNEILAKNLSGGNQQKLILAREIHQNPKLLIAAYPTRGLDVGSCEYVRKKIIEQSDKGTAILYISNEIDEIINVSDRIAVICNGELIGIVDPEEISVEKLGLMMSGIKEWDE